jgi:hypothetical protein
MPESTIYRRPVQFNESASDRREQRPSARNIIRIKTARQTYGRIDLTSSGQRQPIGNAWNSQSTSGRELIVVEWGVVTGLFV